jgi:hypothetical protein
MPRALRIGLLLLLLLAVLFGAYELPVLLRQLRLFGPEAQREEQARREVIRPRAEGPEARKEKVAIYWLATENPETLEAVETPLELGADPAQRARVALETLITSPPSPAARVLPLDASLLAFYLLPDGTAVADFSEALSREVPSGISSEQLAVDAIVRTLHSAVPQVQRLRILIGGQEVETLAGHVDLGSALNLSGMSAPPAALAPQPPAGNTAPPKNPSAPAAEPVKIPAPASTPPKSPVLPPTGGSASPRQPTSRR